MNGGADRRRRPAGSSGRPHPGRSWVAVAWPSISGVIDPVRQALPGGPVASPRAIRGYRWMSDPFPWLRELTADPESRTYPYRRPARRCLHHVAAGARYTTNARPGSAPAGGWHAVRVLRPDLDGTVPGPG